MPKITELYAWVCEDGNPDDEGVPAISTPEGAMPLMGADLERAKSLKPVAQEIAKSTGKSIRLIRSVAIETVEEIKP